MARQIFRLARRGLRIAYHPKLKTLLREDGAYMTATVGDPRSSRKYWTYGIPYESSRGYIRHKNYAIHRAIAEMFIPNPENKPTVDHIDRNRSNNSVSNLRWATQHEQRMNSSQVIGHDSEANKKVYSKKYKSEHVRYTDENGKRRSARPDQVIKVKYKHGGWKYVLK